MIVRRDGMAVEAKDILNHIRVSTARFWLPDAVEFVDTLPLTGTGKVSKAALRRQFQDYRLPNANAPAHASVMSG